VRVLQRFFRFWPFVTFGEVCKVIVKQWI